MAYTTATLNMLVSGTGGGNGIWHYTNTDAHTDIDGTNYFSDGPSRGMKLYDIVFVIDTDTATMTTHYVSEVSSDGATIAAATLA